MSFISWYLNDQRPRRVFQADSQSEDGVKRVRLRCFGPGPVLVRSRIKGAKDRVLSLDKNEDLTLETSDLDLFCKDQKEARGVLEVTAL